MLPPRPAFASVEEDWERDDLVPRSQMNGPPLAAGMGYHQQSFAQPVPLAPRPSAGGAFGYDAGGDDDWYRGYSRPPLLPPQASSSGAGWDHNKRIWEAANTAPPLFYNQNQFPSLGVSSNASSSRTTSPNPSAGPGGGAKITLLKRPTASPAAGTGSGSSSSSGRNTPPTKTLSQREEEYRLARERIFAGSGGGGGSASGGSGTSPLPGTGSGTGSRSGGNGNGSRRTPPGSSAGGQNSGPDVAANGITRQPHGPARDGSGGFGARSGSGRGRARN